MNKGRSLRQSHPWLTQSKLDLQAGNINQRPASGMDTQLSPGRIWREGL
jgi:hypothetical protein